MNRFCKKNYNMQKCKFKCRVVLSLITGHETDVTKIQKLRIFQSSISMFTAGFGWCRSQWVNIFFFFFSCNFRKSVCFMAWIHCHHMTTPWDKNCCQESLQFWWAVVIWTDYPTCNDISEHHLQKKNLQSFTKCVVLLCTIVSL